MMKILLKETSWNKMNTTSFECRLMWRGWGMIHNKFSIEILRLVQAVVSIEKNPRIQIRSTSKIIEKKI